MLVKFSLSDLQILADNVWMWWVGARIGLGVPAGGVGYWGIGCSRLGAEGAVLGWLCASVEVGGSHIFVQLAHQSALYTSPHNHTISSVVQL